MPILKHRMPAEHETAKSFHSRVEDRDTMLAKAVDLKRAVVARITGNKILAKCMRIKANLDATVGDPDKFSEPKGFEHLQISEKSENTPDPETK